MKAKLNTKSISRNGKLFLIILFSLGINVYGLYRSHRIISSENSSSSSGSVGKQHTGMQPLKLQIDDKKDNTAPLAKKQPNNRQKVAASSSSSLRKRQRQYNIPPKPDGWEQMGFQDIRESFNCKTYSHSMIKPLPTLEYWQFLRETYLKHVDPDITFDDTVPPNKGYNFDNNGSPPPYYAGHGDRGRGLFASRDITKGELVHDGTKSDIVFSDAMSYGED